jgi:hypothetical protein
MWRAETENLQIEVVSFYAARGIHLLIDAGTYGHGIFVFMDTNP